MRLLHTADWHLGHTLHQQSRHEEHAAFLRWLAETIADLDFHLTKVDTKDNLSDIFTKGVTNDVLTRLLPRFGMRLASEACRSDP